MAQSKKKPGIKSTEYPFKFSPSAKLKSYFEFCRTQVPLKLKILSVGLTDVDFYCGPPQLTRDQCSCCCSGGGGGNQIALTLLHDVRKPKTNSTICSSTAAIALLTFLPCLCFFSIASRSGP